MKSRNLDFPIFIIAQKGCNVYGKIKVVDYGEDYKVKFVDYGEDLKIKYVDYGEGEVGKWKTVDYGEDFNPARFLFLRLLTPTTTPMGLGCGEESPGRNGGGGGGHEELLQLGVGCVSSVGVVAKIRAVPPKDESKDFGTNFKFNR